MTSQLIQFSEIFSHDWVLLSFGIGDNPEDDAYFQIFQNTKALHASKIFDRMPFPKDLENWTRRTLFAYKNNFQVDVILRGVVCAIDLGRLIIHAAENNADLACATIIIELVRPRRAWASMTAPNLDRRSLACINICSDKEL